MHLIRLTEYGQFRTGTTDTQTHKQPKVRIIDADSIRQVATVTVLEYAPDEITMLGLNTGWVLFVKESPDQISRLHGNSLMNETLRLHEQGGNNDDDADLETLFGDEGSDDE